MNAYEKVAKKKLREHAAREKAGGPAREWGIGEMRVGPKRDLAAKPKRKACR